MEYEFRWYRNKSKKGLVQADSRLQYRTRESYEIDDYIHYTDWSDWQDIPYVEEK